MQLQRRNIVLVLSVYLFAVCGVFAQNNYIGVLPGRGIDYRHEWLLDKNKLCELNKVIVKKEVLCIVAELKTAAGRCGSLKSFGRNTMSQASDILGIGNQSVEFLSCAIQERNLDWKIKFWIVDILGYLKCDSSMRVLKRIMLNKDEMPEIRKRAVQSFERISGKIA